MPSKQTVGVTAVGNTCCFILVMFGDPACKGGNTLCAEGCRCNTGGQSVHCNGTSLTAVPLMHLTDVQKLVLSEKTKKKKTVFEKDSFVQMTELEYLEVFRVGLRTIDLGIFNGLTKLTYLVITGTEMSEIIPGTFMNLSKLEILLLVYNKLEHLEVDAFSGLVMYLFGNKLQYLHPATLF
jgi:hypothetical protein